MDCSFVEVEVAVVEVDYRSMIPSLHKDPSYEGALGSETLLDSCFP